MPTGTTNPTIYKTISLENAKNRPMKPLSSSDKTQANNIIAKFVTYMKNKHS